MEVSEEQCCRVDSDRRHPTPIQVILSVEEIKHFTFCYNEACV